MGNCVGNYSSLCNRSKTNMLKERTQYKPQKQIKYKLLILGAGQSGKSTLLKQLRFLHGRRYDISELLSARYHIHENVIQAMRTLAIYSDIFNFWTTDDLTYTKLKNDFGGLELVSAYLRIECCTNYYFDSVPHCIEQLCSLFLGRIKDIRDRVARMSLKQKFTKQHYHDFKILWKDHRIKKTFENRHKFQLIDTAEYLFDNMHKYCRDDYIPTVKDFIHSYQRTTGVNKIKFAMKKYKSEYQEVYEIFDVGGQKNERRKWMHFFDNTAAIIFVAALSGYNQLLWEDNRNNRMREAIGLFRGIVNLDVFKESHIILFLNKIDLFEKKVGICPIKEYFTDFQDEETYEDVINFFKQKFRDQRRDKRDGQKTEIHFHVTCATDTSCVKKMFESCRTIIIKKELQIQGFL
eukprot:275699_1